MSRLSYAGVFALAVALWAPRPFDTAATFSVDGRTMQLRSAVALASAHPNAGGFSTIEIYFYAFPLTADESAAVSSSGRVDALERRRHEHHPGDPDLNHSRAVLGLLFDRQQQLTNASLELPGLTCTIIADSSTAADAVQQVEHDAGHVRVRTKGSKSCDLTSVGAGTHPLSWDVDVTLPLITKRS